MAKSKKSAPSDVSVGEKQHAMGKDPEQVVGGFTPWTTFQAAVKAVPALKYALAVLGIVSAIAIIRGFGVDFRIAVFGTVTMLVLMVALVVFAALTKVTSPHIRLAALLLMWSFLALTILSAALLFTSTFFNFPKSPTDLFQISSSIPSDPIDTTKIVTSIVSQLQRRPFAGSGVTSEGGQGNITSVTVKVTERGGERIVEIQASYSGTAHHKPNITFSGTAKMVAVLRAERLESPTITVQGRSSDPVEFPESEIDRAVSEGLALELSKVKVESR